MATSEPRYTTSVDKIQQPRSGRATRQIRSERHHQLPLIGTVDVSHRAQVVTSKPTLLGVNRRAIKRRQDADRAASLLAEAR